MHFASGRSIERPQQMQQCALARAALPDNCQKLAAAHFEIDSQQHRNIERAFAVVLFQIDRGEMGGGGIECEMGNSEFGVWSAERRIFCRR